MGMKSVLTFLFLIIVCSFNCLLVLSQDVKVDKICASNRFIDQCSQLQRGSSEVECQWVQDSIECARRIMNGTADFGIFSAESTLHLASLGWEGMTVIKELRHQERIHEPVDFESVVLIRNSFTGGLRNLTGLKYCHPGFFYDKTQKWSERFLKHFERTVAPVDCTLLSAIESPAELETRTLNDFFGSSCRPGIWSMDPVEDNTLKQKYPNLCSLCGDDGCRYPGNSGGHHAQALDCLKSGGDIAYVSAQEAKAFIVDNGNQFTYLCPNGSTSLGSCAWLRQPWKTIIAQNTRNLDLAPKISRWLSSTGAWASAINEIIKSDNHYPMQTTIQTPRDYVRAIREIPLSVNLCSTQAIWCGISPLEFEKCEVIRHAGITTGIQPTIECRAQVNNDVACLNDISQFQSDFTGIDSSLGFLARRIYNLSNALYAETENHRYSSAGVVIKDGSSFTRFENLKNSKACFQEFDGIASIAFINIGKGRGFMNSDDCNYGRLLSNFFSESCAPGARDILHDPSQSNPENLCSLCKSSINPGNMLQQINQANTEQHKYFDQNGEVVEITPITTEFPIEGSDTNFEGHVESAAPLAASCEATITNRFYNNKGALQCLFEVGDVAVLELQNLDQFARELNLDSRQFRVMCQNGSLANDVGFNVDAGCPLTIIVDGEVVVRRNDRKTQGIVNALLSFDRYLNLDPDFKMYNIFASERHLLFKDSMLGLVTGQEANLASTVENYISLFRNTDACMNASTRDPNSAQIMLLNIYLIVTILCFNSFRYIF